MAETKRNTKHKDAQNELAEKFRKKLGDEDKVSTKGNNLPISPQKGKPTRKEAVYRPDIIVRDNEENIRYIVEVETSDRGGKTVAGAAILADYCIDKHMQSSNNKPQLLFVILEGNLELAKKRISAIENWIRHLKIEVCTKEEAMKKIASLPLS